MPLISAAARPPCRRLLHLLPNDGPLHDAGGLMEGLLHDRTTRPRCGTRGDGQQLAHPQRHLAIWRIGDFRSHRRVRGDVAQISQK